MAGYAYPTTAHNSRAVTPREYEDLMHPMAPDGLIGSPALTPLVYADSTLLGVKVRASRAALLRGLRWDSGDTEVSLTVDANSTAGTTRKDLIVLRLSRNPWTIGLAVVKGSALATPTTPSPTYGEDTSTGVWELPLAEVTVPYNDTVTDAGQCIPLAWYVGSDGQLLCTSTTRPPHEPGRRIRELDTGRSYESNGTVWVLLLGDTGWIDLTAEAGWTGASTSIKLRAKNGTVWCRWDTHRVGSTVAAGALSTAFLIPAEYRTTVGMSESCDLLGGATAVAHFAPSGTMQLRADEPMAAGVIARGSKSWPL
ncbi:hypothetical protein [Micromonospora carbonacea]|uniref:Uncharacterized protein n=1 Tax=Micromonospora carbonacea TaxID=47853 RepID=A0A1C5ABM6_9ACTN|nr:hypothetical protein [Micromonospora carbonacea]SCF42652.1 hypothetical protein GA0070563_112109 [Micromonospora carbonacea]